ncbi:transmembrane protein 106B-like, partial [Patiria miniata]|uniref:Transmembrane protein 106B n=1 Tax=Patiria miniata TaxID=46514 RepID=A0A914BMP3_PATMI
HSDPSRPILDSMSSSSGNYSTIDKNNRANDVKDRLNSNPVSPAASARASGTMYSYEELGSGLTCPTCQGTGKIPRGQEDDLVALIPYNDKRLKPRRTWLYVFLSFLLCVVLAGTLCAFLIPRTVDVVHDNVTTLHVDLNVSTSHEHDTCALELMLFYNITNNNFVSVTTNDIQLQVTVLFHNKIITTEKFVKNEAVPIRATELLKQPVNMTLTNQYFPVKYCSPIQTRDSFIYMMFQSTFNFTLMTRTDQQVITAYFRVNCNPDQAVDGDGFPILQSIGKEEYPGVVDWE